MNSIRHTLQLKKINMIKNNDKVYIRKFTEEELKDEPQTFKDIVQSSKDKIYMVEKAGAAAGIESPSVKLKDIEPLFRESELIPVNLFELEFNKLKRED